MASLGGTSSYPYAASKIGYDFKALVNKILDVAALRYFTLEEFMDCCAKYEGNFTYCTDWSGFNVPGNTILEFIELFQNDT